MNTNLFSISQPENLVDTTATCCGIQPTMKTLGERLKSALKDRGISESRLAEMVGASQQAINFIANGTTKNPRNLGKIANALGINEAWLRYGSQSGDNEPEEMTRPRAIRQSDLFATYPAKPVARDDLLAASINDLPVYGTPAGMDGITLETESPQSFTGRPPMLIGNNRGFAVFMIGESMSPRFDHGEMLWVDPVQPPQIGDYVLVVDQNNFAIPRQLIAIKSETIELLARNDETESIVKREDIRHLYKIVGQRAL